MITRGPWVLAFARGPWVLAFARRPWALAFALTALGCDTGPAIADGGDADGAVDAVEIGTWRESFVPLGEELELVMGPQGGWHLDLGARLSGFDRSMLTLEYAVVRRSDGAVLARAPIRTSTTGLALDGELGIRIGDRVILDIASPADVTPGDVELSIEVTDASGAHARDARVVAIVDAIDEI